MCWLFSTDLAGDLINFMSMQLYQLVHVCKKTRALKLAGSQEEPGTRKACENAI